METIFSSDDSDTSSYYGYEVKSKVREKVFCDNVSNRNQNTKETIIDTPSPP